MTFFSSFFFFNHSLFLRFHCAIFTTVTVIATMTKRTCEIFSLLKILKSLLRFHNSNVCTFFFQFFFHPPPSLSLPLSLSLSLSLSLLRGK